MKYRHKLMMGFAVPTGTLILLSFPLRLVDPGISISLVTALGGFMLHLSGRREEELSRKFEGAGVEFCADDAEYLGKAAELIRGAKQSALSLLSTWHVDDKILRALEDCQANRIVFVGPIEKGERFPKAIDRIRKTAEINEKRAKLDRTLIQVFHRQSAGIKFVLADDSVLINSRPVKASVERSTAGFVIKHSSDHVRFFQDAFERILHDTGNVAATQRVESMILDIIKEKEPVTREDIGAALHTEGDHTHEEDERYMEDLDWYICNLKAKKLIRATRDGHLALDTLSDTSFIALPDSLNTALCAISERPKPHLSIAVTNLCNLKCIYCPPNGECYRTTPGDMACQSALEVIDIADALGISKIRITGGEPFTYKDLQQVVEHAAARNLEVHINTNGIGLRRNLAWLRELRDRVVIKISLDYATRDAMSIMTPDSGDFFDEIRMGMTDCATTGMLQRLNFVLTTRNWQELPGVLGLAKSCGVGLKIFDMFFVPETEKIWRDLYVPPRVLRGEHQHDFSYTYSLLYGIPTEELEVDGTKVRIKDSTNGTHYHPELCRECEHYPCQEGLYCLVVTPSLTVVPCRLGTRHYVSYRSGDETMKAVERFLRLYETSSLSREFHKDYADLIDQRVDEYLPMCRHLLCAGDHSA